MTEMIERVARAIQKFADATYRDASYPWGIYKTQVAYNAAVARAAIEAMREETDEMYRAGDAHAGAQGTSGDAQQVWRAMIDAALSSAEQTERDSSRDELNPLPETPA